MEIFEIEKKTTQICIMNITQTLHTGKAESPQGIIRDTV